MSEFNENVEQLIAAVNEAETILVLQPEKPDSDSLSTSLALEQILGDLGKEVVMYCQDKLPTYISYYPGADRVQDEFPNTFDITILVDTGGPQQLARTLEKHKGKLAKKPFFIIDHHPNRTPLGIPTIDIIGAQDTSTCELLLHICEHVGWNVSKQAAQLMIPGILADTRNLSIHTVTAETFRTVAKLVDKGANVTASHEAFRDINAIEPELLGLKGRLLSRIELFEGGKIALVIVTPTELKEYAEVHDPADLVIYDMMNALGVQIAVVLRNYGGESRKVKISTRAKMPVAAKACAEFGGGGHDRAAGAQVTNTPIDEVKQKFVTILGKHIRDYEALQHPIAPEGTSPAA